MEPLIERDYEFHAAGRVWVVPEFHLLPARDGTLGASMAEFRRIHRAVAVAICGRPGPLTTEEFEFLCDIADVPYAQVAAMVGLDRSAVTKWMEAGSPMRKDRSNLLKRWFLVRLFGEAMRSHPLRVTALAEDAKMLQRLRREVLRSGAAFDIRERGDTREPMSGRIGVSPSLATAVTGRLTLRRATRAQRDKARKVRHVA